MGSNPTQVKTVFVSWMSVSGCSVFWFWSFNGAAVTAH